jgi:methionine-rich copper-binding protein CopC
MRQTILALFLGLLAQAGFAHSPLRATAPMDGAEIAAAPETISLTFAKDIRLTRVTATGSADQAQELDLSGHKGFATDFTLAFTGIGTGVYQIEWRGLGNDGHALRGVFAFTVAD